jgi:hypothetical protein
LTNGAGNNDLIYKISQIMRNLSQGTLSSFPQGAMPTGQMLPNVQNELLQKQNRLERLVLGSEMKRELSDISRLRDISPDTRATQTFRATTIPSKILEEQYLAYKSTPGRQLTSTTQLTNKELDELEKSFKKLIDAISKGRKEVEIFAGSYPETMRGASRSLGENKTTASLVQALKGSGFFSSSIAMSKGLEQGNILTAGTGAVGTVMGAKAISAGMGLAGGAALASTAALTALAAIGAVTYAGSQIAKKNMLESASSSLGASQLQQAIGGSSYTGGVSTIGLRGNYAGNIEYARLKALELVSGGTLDINQMLGVMGAGAGRTSIVGQRGGALATTLANYGGAGIGADAFSNAVEKFSKITEHSKLTRAIENVPEIMSRGGGTVTAETVAGLTDLAYQVRYGRGVDTGDRTTETLTGLRSSMLLLNAMGIQGDTNQLQMLRGMSAGFGGMASTAAGRGYIYRTTGKIEHALDPEGLIKDPEALASLMSSSIGFAGSIGLKGTTKQATEAMQRDLYMSLFNGNKDWTQLAMTLQKSGEKITPEKIREIQAEASSGGESIESRNKKAQKGGGISHEVSMQAKRTELTTSLDSMTEELGKLVKILKSTSEKTKQITVTSATIVVGTATGKNTRGSFDVYGGN